MKMLISLFLLTISISTYAESSCTVAILKTYQPYTHRFVACDDQNLPAAFAGNLNTLIYGLKGKQYIASTFDQCSNSQDLIKQKYTLASQLGDCVQSGISISCKLYVVLVDTKTSEVKFEKTTFHRGNFNVSAYLSEALSDMPNCDQLN